MIEKQTINTLQKLKAVIYHIKHNTHTTCYYGSGLTWKFYFIKQVLFYHISWLILSNKSYSLQNKQNKTKQKNSQPLFFNWLFWCRIKRHNILWNVFPALQHSWEVRGHMIPTIIQFFFTWSFSMLILIGCLVTTSSLWFLASFFLQNKQYIHENQITAFKTLVNCCKSTSKIEQKVWWIIFQSQWS